MIKWALPGRRTKITGNQVVMRRTRVCADGVPAWGPHRGLVMAPSMVTKHTPPVPPPVGILVYKPAHYSHYHNFSLLKTYIRRNPGSCDRVTMSSEVGRGRRSGRGGERRHRQFGEHQEGEIAVSWEGEGCLEGGHRHPSEGAWEERLSGEG